MDAPPKCNTCSAVDPKVRDGKPCPYCGEGVMLVPERPTPPSCTPAPRYDHPLKSSAQEPFTPFAAPETPRPEHSYDECRDPYCPDCGARYHAPAATDAGDAREPEFHEVGGVGPGCGLLWEVGSTDHCTCGGGVSAAEAASLREQVARLEGSVEQARRACEWWADLANKRGEQAEALTKERDEARARVAWWERRDAIFKRYGKHPPDNLVDLIPVDDSERPVLSEADLEWARGVVARLGDDHCGQAAATTGESAENTAEKGELITTSRPPRTGDTP